MAQREIVTLIDDLDGSEASDTLTFGLDGKSYEVDLSDDNAARLRESLAPFVEKARRAGRAPKMSTAGTRPRADRDQTQAIRSWARDNGHQVSDRGRIPKTVVEAFQAAH